MIVINFAHPLTPSQQAQLEQLAGQPISRMEQVQCQFDNEAPFAGQVVATVDAAGLSPEEWQGEEILVNPPGYAPAATTLVAELHGRMGYFPSLIRVRPVNDSVPPVFEVAEILNLQAVRERARLRRMTDSE